MIRCFVAIDLPDEIKDQLQQVQPRILPGMRLVEQQQMHLTLHFLGETNERAFEKVLRAFSTIQLDQFSIRLSGVGQFPALGPPRVLWVGVDANPALLTLHRDIGELLTDEIGYVPEVRPFSPHITLARFNGPTSLPALQQYLRQNQQFSIADVSVGEVALYSSTHVDRRPKYVKEAVITTHD